MCKIYPEPKSGLMRHYEAWLSTEYHHGNLQETGITPDLSTPAVHLYHTVSSATVWELRGDEVMTAGQLGQEVAHDWGLNWG